MITKIILIIIFVLVFGVGVWSWWFENGKNDTSQNSIDEEKRSEE